MNHPEQSQLGKKTSYDSQYNPEKLFPISRKINRDKIGLSYPLPFFGYDLWNHYEVSWLDQNGKPIVAIAEIIYDCESENIIESKSMKLYFNTFNNTKIESGDRLKTIIENDISSRIHCPASVKITTLQDYQNQTLFSGFTSTCIDDLPIICDEYQTNPNLLMIENDHVEESVYSNLLRSNCLVTSQPDWGSLLIDYKGKKINHASLLKYIVSFRHCFEFHETSIEHIFMDIMRQCRPEFLSVYGRFTRRGGLDINVLRSSEKLIGIPLNNRLCRQ